MLIILKKGGLAVAKNVLIFGYHNIPDFFVKGVTSLRIPFSINNLLFTFSNGSTKYLYRVF
jgi:hypothetical protein